LRLGKARKIETENPSVQKQFLAAINGFGNEKLSDILLEESKQI
jgi:hypothetical protein